ncbi:MAG: hypothetical protein MJD61_17365 [Proteobacteria bacterium]|nr:hypothetical protein [Pseudomonadota bacterium]
MVPSGSAVRSRQYEKWAPAERDGTGTVGPFNYHRDTALFGASRGTEDVDLVGHGHTFAPEQRDGEPDGQQPDFRMAKLPRRPSSSLRSSTS